MVAHNFRKCKEKELLWLHFGSLHLSLKIARPFSAWTKEKRLVRILCDLSFRKMYTCRACCSLSSTSNKSCSQLDIPILLPFQRDARSRDPLLIQPRDKFIALFSLVVLVLVRRSAGSQVNRGLVKREKRRVQPGAFVGHVWSDMNWAEPPDLPHCWEMWTLWARWTTSILKHWLAMGPTVWSD